MRAALFRNNKVREVVSFFYSSFLFFPPGPVGAALCDSPPAESLITAVFGYRYNWTVAFVYEGLCSYVWGASTPSNLSVSSKNPDR